MNKLIVLTLVFTIFSQAIYAGPSEDRSAEAYRMVKEARYHRAAVLNAVAFGAITGAGVWFVTGLKGMGPVPIEAQIGFGIVGYFFMVYGGIGLFFAMTTLAEGGTIEDHYAVRIDEFMKLPEDQAIRMLQSPEGAQLRKNIFSLQQALIETEAAQRP